MGTAYRLRAGDTGPVQQSPVTCGSACLTVARMLVDPVFASWVRTGTPHLPGSPGGATQAERFAAYERVVMRRTNGIFAGHHRLNTPWPRALGTPPWGAKRELEYGASAEGTLYDVSVVRQLSRESLRGAFEHLVDVVSEGEPGLLYVGSARLPRHVVLVLPGDGDRVLDVYDPGSGRVTHLRRDTVIEHRLGLSGWNVPWFVVQPTGHRRVREFSSKRSLGGVRATSSA
ncbi:hypothetical protein N802_01370 [Knoellia sinensis KCTC 19936]|uniref:Peptidase C39-like domain-containing protein n=1 Tax=Knoellia sinensis KCTC 19936 TaxID=1385520 RepID=A0A0A0JD21_9MICO|nr:hypothetical protein [Knoellia sinensis]KGN35023.1 hypothetical protein N802_01370 [Knoellia sinensis KCTC 19936]